jgi:copper transport protein
MRATRWLFLLAAAWAGGAAGHAGLVASVPADGAALALAPATIELRFSEAVTPIRARLFAGSVPLPLTVPQTAGDLVTLALPANLGKGVYTLSYRVTSADSHPVGGSIVFAIGEPAPLRSEVGVGAEPSAGRVALRAVRDLALLIAAGGALFAVCLAGFPGERVVLSGAALVALVASLGSVGTHGAQMLDDGLWSREAWRTGLVSSFGLSVSVAAAGALMILVASMALRRRARLGLLLAGSLTAIASLPLTGHSMIARPAAIAMPALAAHGMAAAFWIGSLAALFAITTVRASSDAAVALVLRRFSRWGITAVAILVTAGTAFVVLQLASPDDLYGSRYGQLIVGKIVLLLALLVLAALNRFRWLPMLERGVSTAAKPLRWSIGGEVLLATCVVALTAMLVQTPPPSAASGFTQKLAYKGDFAEISVKPARAGANSIVVRLRDREGVPFDPEELLVEIGNERAGVEPSARTLRRIGPGEYRRDGSELAFPGVWTLEVRAQLDGTDIASFRVDVPVR